MPIRHDLAAAVAAAGIVLPDRLGLDRRFPLVDVVAWRPHASVTLLAGAATLLTRRRRRRTGALLGAVGLAGVAAVAGRAVAGAPPAGPGPGDVTILTSNVRQGRADTGALAAVIERTAPDFVVLPEAGPDFRDKLVPLIEILGYRGWASTVPGTPDAKGVVLLVAERAGPVVVRPDAGMMVRHLEATGGILGGRSLFAVHTAAPVDPTRTAEWRSDLALMARWCRAPVAPIVAGDLNATLDHSALRAAVGACRSAASGTGRGLVGTYPSMLPRALGIQIDHVLVPAAAVTTRFEIIDVAGTDHRAVLASVALPPVRHR